MKRLDLKKQILLLMAVFLLSVSPLSASDIWVSVSGNDKNEGTQVDPLQTLNAALRMAREYRRTNHSGVEDGIIIHLKGGEYHLYEPIFIR
ncbi:MAG: DUF1565 domain-containing protein, partial [Bacteroidaceae bacterium]|nr:DUF1565 domain-containing protein [Bacteroidaceae bacterium]